MTFVTKISFKISMRGIFAFLLLFYIGVIWTIIKGDYREFLNEGSRQQVVIVSEGAAADKLTDLVSGLNSEAFNEGIARFFYRIQYVYHLSKAMDMVPVNMPYQNGNVWMENVVFATVPRFINPNKGRFEASVKTRKFTGLTYSGAAQGVSYSFGYFADSYVDFGVPGMYIPLMIIAFIYAQIFRFLLLKATNNLIVNFSIVIAFFVQFLALESDGTFLIGRIFTSFVVFFILKYTLFKKLENFIKV